ncbi:helix-turn-helix transcriptional regulator [Streptomyces goshikiensis]|uniref:helix-turn-helix domain-containing protein n=1 Tax=Streptomyces goshikiensis TaxID=1942 RepID=UPI0033F658CE
MAGKNTWGPAMTARRDYGAALKAAAGPYLARDGQTQETLAAALSYSGGALSKILSGKSLPHEEFLERFCEVLEAAGTPVPPAEKNLLEERRHKAFLSRPASEQSAYLKRRVERLERELEEVKESRPSQEIIVALRGQVQHLEEELRRARGRLRGMSGSRELVPMGTRLPELSPLRPRSRRIDADLARFEAKARTLERELNGMGAPAVRQQVAVRMGDPGALVATLDSAASDPDRLAEALATLRERSGGDEAWPSLRMAESAFPVLRSAREGLVDAVESALNGTAVLAYESALRRLVKDMGASDAELVAFTAAHGNIQASDVLTLSLPDPSQPLGGQPPTRWQRLHAYLHSSASVMVCGTLSSFTVVSHGGRTMTLVAVWTLGATVWATVLWAVIARPLGGAAAPRPALLTAWGCPVAALLPVVLSYALR